MVIFTRFFFFHRNLAVFGRFDFLDSEAWTLLLFPARTERQKSTSATKITCLLLLTCFGKMSFFQKEGPFELLDVSSDDHVCCLTSMNTFKPVDLLLIFLLGDFHTSFGCCWRLKELHDVDIYMVLWNSWQLPTSRIRGISFHGGNDIPKGEYHNQEFLPFGWLER